MSCDISNVDRGEKYKYFFLNMELRGGVEIPIALWRGLERRMGMIFLHAARDE